MNDYIKATGVIIVLVAVLAALPYAPRTTPNNQVNFAEQSELKRFQSETELKTFLLDAQNSNGIYGYGAGMMRGAADMMETATASAPNAALSAQKSDSYSTTNVQVAGVDEADYVKNDGKYIYTVANNSVVIVDAYPAEDARIVSTIKLDNTNIGDIYLSGDHLIVFGNRYGYYGGPMPLAAETKIAAPMDIMPPRYSQPSSQIKIFDITDRSNPVLVKELEFNGSYQNSRMIGDYVYAIFNSQPYYSGGDVVVPFTYRDIYYFPVPDSSYQFTQITPVNVKTGEIGQGKVFLMGYSSSLFVSQDNIYLVYQKQIPSNYIYNRVMDEIIIPLLPPEIRDNVTAIRSSDMKEYEKQMQIEEALNAWRDSMNPEQIQTLYEQFSQKYEQIQQDMAKELEKSVVHKVSIKDGVVGYVAKGEVPGYPLNQFSMDEYNGYFRIATTTGQWSGKSLNHVYVLDSGMNTVGRLEDLAKGERIYSVRFMGNRAYMVTFVQVDPLFVLDLSDPTNPTVLGELKIPGYSDYLHPYDETHIIGVGKDVDPTIDMDKVHTEGAVYYTAILGVKVSLFDVSDVANPKEVSKYIIGDRGSESAVSSDHKAFLLDKTKGIMVIPVSVYETKPTQSWGEFVYQGAYVFNIDTSGFTLRGRVTHITNITDYNYWPYSISRSLYIGDNLYTLSQSMLKANALSDLSQLAAIELPHTDYYHGILYAAMEGGVDAVPPVR